jgi:hypothetical protein
MDINLIWDSSVSNASPAFRTAMMAAANFLDNLIVNPITVNIKVGYGEDDNGTYPIPITDLSLGGALAFQTMNYSHLKSALVANAETTADQQAMASLPASDPTNGATFFVSDAEASALGLLPANSNVMEGAVGFSNTVSWNYNTNGQAVPGEIDFVSAAELELIHALGMLIGTPSGGSTAFMLFRYSTQAVHELTVNSDGITTPAAYFSIDGGQTNLGNYLTSGDSTLFNAGGNIAINDTLAAPYSLGQGHAFSATDALELNVLGFNVNATYAALESALVTPQTTATYTAADVNGWFQTINGLPSTTAPVPTSLSDAYVAELNAGAQTPAQVQAGLENPAVFYRTNVADFVLREFQAAWGVLPTTGAGSQYDNWVARVIANPSLENGGMSEALAGTPQFQEVYGVTGTTIATLATVQTFALDLLGIQPANLGPGALANVGLPVWQVLQNFAQSSQFTAHTASSIVTFQNALLEPPVAQPTPVSSIQASGVGSDIVQLTGTVSLESLASHLAWHNVA